MHQLVENSINPLTSQGPKTLSGIFAEIDTFNQNGRRYGEEVYMPAYNNLMPKIQERRLLGELDHPLEYDEVRLANVSHVITETHIVDEDGTKRVRGTVELLDTPSGLIAQALVKAGINLGISSRGLGATRKVRDGVDVTQLTLITYDLVAEPSFATAILTPDQTAELSDSLNYIESQIPLNESKENSSVRDMIHRIRESLIVEKNNLEDKLDIDQVEIDSLRKLLESTQAIVKSDTEVLTESRSQIHKLRKELEEVKEDYNALLENMHSLQEAYNNLKETTHTSTEVDELQETILELRKSLAIEKRGMSREKVSNLLEGASTEEEIENRLNSLSKIGRQRKTQILYERAQTVTPQTKKLSGLASIVSKV